MVILLHGLGRSTGSMRPLAWRLGRAGFATKCIGYPSTRGTVAENEAAVRASLAGTGQIDIVGHSLGGIIAARLLRDPQGLTIRRVVQLGSPNRGSPLADRLAPLWAARTLCGPTLTDLNAATGPLPRHPDIAAIAGTGGWPGIPLPRPHDGAVTALSAWTGAGHRTAVPVLHTLLPLSPAVAKRVAEFLTTGRFAA